MTVLRALLRLPGAFLTMLSYVPAYIAGALWESLRQGWRAGRDDVKGLTAE